MSAAGSPQDVEIHIQAHNKLVEKLVASVNRYRDLVDSMPNILFVCDESGELSFVNRAWQQILGGDEAEALVGRNLEEFIHVEDMEQVLPIGEISTPREIRVLDSGGNYRWMKIQARKRNEKHFQGLLVDVSEARKLEEMLRNSHRMEAIGRLSGWMAHEFNNLLTVILGGADRLMRAEKQESRDWQREASRIHKAATQGAILTSQLLTFSSQQMMSYSVVNLADGIRSSISLLEGLVASKRISIHMLGFDDQDLVVRVDSNQLVQVVMNLVLNSRDALHYQGNLWFELSSRFVDGEDGEALELEAGEYAVFAVEDDGCGIDESIQDQIFEPFFTTKEPGRGTGFGLAGVHGIVKQSNGAITVQSTLGVGSRFEVYLPLVSRAVGAKNLESQSNAAGQASRILFVEDEESILEMSSEALRESGFIVDTACSGQDAIQMIETEGVHYDLVVTDVIMPQEGGKMLLHYLSAIDNSPEIIAVSGFDRAILDDTAPDVPFLQKPYRIHDLIQKVEEILSVR
ncbi:MAG: ATP-binding protein [Planctomycetota bacterium]|nr:ATP-binding protein [Planctomycetota bacterium]